MVCITCSREKVKFASYQLRYDVQVWYTQLKDNRLSDSGPIDWEEFEKAFLGKNLTRRGGMEG